MGGMKRYMATAAILFLLFSCQETRLLQEDSAPGGDVPLVYRGVYHELSTKLGDLKTAISIRPKAEGHCFFGVELLVANSNRGEILLTDRVLRATVLTLDRLQDLGVQSIAVSIQHPILVSTFPRSAEYRNFYRQVAAEIRKRKIAFIIEVGTTFREPEFSKLKVEYSELTMGQFKKELREMATFIIEDLKPDYLTLFTEPDTQSRNTGLDFSVSNFSAVVRHVAKGLNHKEVRLGAGAGTWDDMDYFSALVGIPELDYIDMHIYPVQRDFLLDRVAKVAKLSQSRGKGVSIGETWLYKVSRRELGKISPVKAFARDVYSFWQPLDNQFLTIIVNLSRQVDAEFCSFFWMKYFYAYLDYSMKTKNLHPQRLIAAADAAAGRNILTNTLSETGKTFKTLLAPQP
ncbi:MAG: hypothetical protein PVI06_10285 [Desulfobacterales bacterium]|jgi:hypothetical protein